MNTGLSILGGLGACSPAIRWAEAYRGKPAEKAWRECERGDWLLWIAARVGVDRRLVVKAACACARTSLCVWESRYPNDRRPHRAIETAEAWCGGKATVEDTVIAAANAATDAADTATHAAANAANAAYGAIAANAADATHKQHAHLVRKIIPWSAVQAAAWPELEKA